MADVGLKWYTSEYVIATFVMMLCTIAAIHDTRLYPLVVATNTQCILYHDSGTLSTTTYSWHVQMQNGMGKVWLENGRASNIGHIPTTTLMVRLGLYYDFNNVTYGSLGSS